MSRKISVLFLLFLSFGLIGQVLDIDNSLYYPPFHNIVSLQRFGTVMYIASTSGILKYDLSNNKRVFVMKPNENFHPIIINGFFVHPYYPLEIVLTRNYIYFYYPKMNVYKKHRHLMGHYSKDIDKIGFSPYKTYIKFKDGTIISRLNSELQWYKDSLPDDNIEWFPKIYMFDSKDKKNISVVYRDDPYLWVGTHDKGVYYYNGLYEKLISHIRMGPLSVKNLSLFKDGDTVYVGGNRVRSFLKLEFPDSMKWNYVNFSHDIVYDIFGFSRYEDTVYFYGYHKCWAYYDDAVKEVFEDTTVNILFYDRKNNIVFTDKYFTVNNDTLRVFNNRVRFCSFYNDTLMFTVKDTLYIWGNGDLWKFDLFDLQRVYTVACDSNSIIISEDAHVFLLDKKETKAYQWDYISPSRVTSIVKKGNYIFLSTEGDGLLVLNTKTGRWGKYNEKNGLISNFIYSMVEIHNGLLLSVQGGLIFIPFKEVL